MNLEYLKYFKQIVDQKSITKAAKESHITQSALTQILQKLESDLKCELLIRSNKGIETTECGQLVYEYSLKLLDVFESMESRLTCVNEGCHSVVIKPCCSLNNTLLPSIFFKAQSHFKNVKFDVIIGQKQKTISEIRIGITDFGVVMGNLELEDDVESNTVGNEHIVLISGNDLIIKDKISMKELMNYKIIDFSLGSYSKEVHRIIGQYLHQDENKSVYQPFFSIDSLEAIKSLVENNFGVAFLPKYAISEELKSKKFKVVQVEQFNMQMPIHVLSRRDELNTPIIIQIKKYLIEHMSKYFSKQQF